MDASLLRGLLITLMLLLADDAACEPGHAEQRWLAISDVQHKARTHFSTVCAKSWGKLMVLKARVSISGACQT